MILLIAEKKQMRFKINDGLPIANLQVEIVDHPVPAVDFAEHRPGSISPCPVLLFRSIIITDAGIAVQLLIVCEAPPNKQAAGKAVAPFSTDLTFKFAFPYT